MWSISLLVLLLVPSIRSQCLNAGTLQADSSCACPVGFGGKDCGSPACGGDLFAGSKRPLSQAKNLTSDNCGCENGWGGVGCNVCQTANACQAGFKASGQPAPSSTPSIGTDGVPIPVSNNNTLVCNSSPRVYASSQMSCNVINPTLQGIFPGKSSLNIIRTVDPSLSPLPNTTSYGSTNTVFAQLFYDGAEQFYCSADTCAQDLSNPPHGGSTYNCQNLLCRCISGSTFCGGGRSNLTLTLNGLTGNLGIECQAPDATSGSSTCNFKQETLSNVFGDQGLALDGCTFGECVAQRVIDSASNSTSSSNDTSGSSKLSPGVIAGLAVVGGLIFVSLVLLLLGLIKQRKARKAGYIPLGGHKAGIEWSNITYIVPTPSSSFSLGRKKKNSDGTSPTTDKAILDNVNGRVGPGQMMAILGPSGAGKTTLVEILAGKQKSGSMTGAVTFPTSGGNLDRSSLRIGFVPQQDILPPMLTVYETLLFAARLRLPEGVSDTIKKQRVESLLEKLGIVSIRDTRIGDNTGNGRRGISGGEMRRVSIGLELIACPDVLILDEPTSGLDSVSAARVANVLHSIAHDEANPIPIIASIHQPSSHLYHTFDSILVLSHGRAIYSGAGGITPATHLTSIVPPSNAENGTGGIQPYVQGYNVADWLLEVASDPPLSLFNQQSQELGQVESRGSKSTGTVRAEDKSIDENSEKGKTSKREIDSGSTRQGPQSQYATSFLTQLQYLSGREWRILKRDKTLFFTHVAVASVLGVFCGGLYFQTGVSIAGFQSRVGCLFFLGALIAFSSLSALYNIVEIRPLFLRERSSSYYSPTSWLVSRFIFDAIPLRIIPTIIVSTITYWMAGLAHDAEHYFKFLLILVLYTLVMTLFNFLLGTLFHNGGIAILLSALTALYQMTFAGFFVHLNAIPPVLRWLQWLCPLKYTLEALAVNEVGSGLMIVDELEGVPVNVSASLIMNLLFGFGSNNYYRDVLVHVAFIGGFGISVIGTVWWKVREHR